MTKVNVKQSNVVDNIKKINGEFYIKVSDVKKHIDKIAEQIEGEKEVQSIPKDPLDHRIGVSFWNGGLERAVKLMKGYFND